MLGQISTILISLSDTLMVGKYHSIDLAGVAFANGLFYSVFVLGIGISLALKPLVAHADAAKNSDLVRRLLRNGVSLGVFLGVASCLVLLLLVLFAPYLGQEEVVLKAAVPYLKVVALSMIPLLLFFVLKEFSEALRLPKIGMVINILGSIFNILLNYLLIFGNYGFPEMGLTGAAWATFLARLLMLLIMITVFFLNKNLYPYSPLLFRPIVESDIFRKIINLGFPIGVQLFSETTAFSVAGILVGMIGKEAMAAHQIVLNVASATFLTASGIAQGTTVNVANLMGKKQARFVGEMGHSALFLALGFMSVTAALLLFFRNEIPWLFLNTSDLLAPQIALIASQLFVVAGFFQLSDGAQVVSAGNLRGLEDTKIPTYITLFAYWGIAIPIGYLLAFGFDWGATGIWIGLSLGLTVAAILLLLRFWRLIRQINLKKSE
jgi:MATE family multidrug resistance protein